MDPKLQTCKLGRQIYNMMCIHVYTVYISIYVYIYTDTLKSYIYLQYLNWELGKPCTRSGDTTSEGFWNCKHISVILAC